MLSPHAYEKLNEELKEPWLREVVQALYLVASNPKTGLDRANLFTISEVEYVALNAAYKSGCFNILNILCFDLLAPKKEVPKAPPEFGELQPEPNPSRYQPKASPTN